MDATTLTVWAPTLMLVAVRLVGLVLAGPALGHSAVPMKIRIAVAIVVSLAVIARMPGPLELADAPVQVALAVGGEFLVGACIGLSARLVILGVMLGGFHVANQMGLAIGEVAGGTDGQHGGAFRATFGMLAVVIYLLLNGHRQMLSAVLRTFETVPLAGGVAPQSVLRLVVLFLGSSFGLALNIAAPVLIAMLLATVAMGMLQKTLPQCNLLTTHLPVRVLLGLIVLAGSIATVRPLLDGAVGVLFETLAEAL